MLHIAPSLLAADFARLGEQIAECEKAGVNRLHFDVMDGHFVPNLSLGPVILSSISKVTKLPLEVHLMVDNPDKFIKPFADAGASSMIVHLEVLPNPLPVLSRIRLLGKKACLAIKPETPVEKIEPYLLQIDLALCMTVEPGFGGQSYLPQSDERIEQLRRLINRHNGICELEVDGGIDATTAPKAVQAGANVLVSGTGIFRNPRGIATAVKELSKSADLVS